MTRKRKQKPKRPPAAMQWREVPLAADAWPFESKPPTRVWKTKCGQWVAMAFDDVRMIGTPWQGTIRLGVRFAGGEIFGNWSRVQAIKETLFPGRLAVEVYPPETQLVDVAPMRWLWVLPQGMKLPLSLSGSKSTVG